MHPCSKATNSVQNKGNVHDDKVLKPHIITRESIERKQNAVGIAIGVLEERESNIIRVSIHPAAVLRRPKDNRESDQRNKCNQSRKMPSSKVQIF